MTFKALLVGIQYKGRAFKGQPPNSAELCESHKDVKRVQNLIMTKYRYPASSITLLLDDGVHKSPTRANMIDEMKKLVQDAKTGDRLFFHFSGHGSQVEDIDHDEDDGFDEAIWPVDFVEHDEDTYIIDDELRRIMVDHLPPGCYLTALFDSCHSGTILDLPVEHKGTPRSTPQHKTVPLPPAIDIPKPQYPSSSTTTATPPSGIPPRAMSASTPPTGTPPRTIFKVLSSHFKPVAPAVVSRTEASYGLLGLPYNFQAGLGSRARGAVKTAKNDAEEPCILFMEPSKKEVTSPGAIVTSWAACADDQNAYEATTGAGAMVEAFVASLSEPVEHTYATLLQSLSDKLEEFCEKWNKGVPENEQIAQVPQMGSLHSLNMDLPFTL
ncbi:peptidase C14 [Auricularia subglabra TFB-10046 SS5]|nr:peptidase C14 [Auricularia subglabra TFB-10046 SS5]